MYEIIKVQVRFEGETRDWEDMTPLTLTVESFRNEHVGPVLDLVIDIHEQWAKMKVYEVRWTQESSTQGHYYRPVYPLSYIAIQQVE